MKNRTWLEETEKLLQDLPEQILAAWEESNPSARIFATWNIIKRWQKIENYAMGCTCVSLCLAVIVAVTGSPKSEMWSTLIGVGIFYALMIIADFRLIGPEYRIERLRSSVTCLKECGLVPPGGLRHDGRDEVVAYVHVRLVANAILVLNAEDNHKRLLKKGGTVDEMAVAAESVKLFQNQFDRSFGIADIFGLSDPNKGHYYTHADRRISA
ncbi:MAG: hypothetical protein Q7S08_03145 [bacterium]|nr:hypothetical protein [bacterium]